MFSGILITETGGHVIGKIDDKLDVFIDVVDALHKELVKIKSDVDKKKLDALLINLSEADKEHFKKKLGID